MRLIYSSFADTEEDVYKRQIYQVGTGGPSIGLLCEYDALKGFGHGCGHHMQGPAVLGAAAALRRCLGEDTPAKIVVCLLYTSRCV